MTNASRMMFLIPAIVSVALGLGVLGYIDISFIPSEQQLFFAGWTLVIAGVWLAFSMVFHFFSA